MPTSDRRPDSCEPLKAAHVAGRLDMAALARGQYPGRPMPPGLLPGVSSVGYWDATTPQTWGLDWHCNEGIELTFLETGAMPFAVDGGAYLLLPDQFTITRPWQPHRVGDPHVHVGRLHWVILDVGVRRPHQAWRWPAWLLLARRDLDELTTMLRCNEQHVWSADPALRACFRRLSEAVRRAEADPSAAESWLRLHLNALMLHLLEHFRRHAIALSEALTDSRRSVALFLAELETQLDRPWTLAEMATHCGLGATRFTEYCRQITNRPPARYLNDLRLEAAAARLRADAACSVTEAALACGFSSGQYFATAFRRRYGCAPGAWRAAG